MALSEQFIQFGLVALAGGLGAVLGLEREVSHKPAGLRTHIFVCGGAALLMIMGDAVITEFRSQGHEGLEADPLRIMQAIVIGISFLGTGTIIHQGGTRVEGLTTAASIFLTAGIGIAVAVNHILLAGATTLFGVFVLIAIGWMERRFNRAETSTNHDTDA